MIDSKAHLNIKHQARHRLLHRIPSFVVLFAVIQSFHLISVLSHSAVLLPASHGLSLFLFPSGAQVSAVLVLLYFSLLRMWPMYFQAVGKGKIIVPSFLSIK